MTISGHCFPQVHINLPQNLGSECYFGQRSLWAVYCRRNCFESVKIWRSRLGSSNFLIKTWFLSLLVCLFLLLNCSSWVADILMKSWIEKHFTVEGTAFKLSKFDTADLVLAIFWIILFFFSWHDYKQKNTRHQSHQGVISWKD